jgi:hypothetical protein
LLVGLCNQQGQEVVSLTNPSLALIHDATNLPLQLSAMVAQFEVRVPLRDLHCAVLLLESERYKWYHDPLRTYYDVNAVPSAARYGPKVTGGVRYAHLVGPKITLSPPHVNTW